MSEEKRSHRTQIIVALVGLAGVLGTAFFANLDKIFPRNEDTQAGTSTVGSGQDGTSGYLASSVSGTLPAPKPENPACDTTIRRISDSKYLVLGWEPVEGASTYAVEIDCFGCREFGRTWHSVSGIPWHVKTGLGLRSPIYSSKLHIRLRDEGGLAIRWRAWAIDDNEVAGAKSDWCKVSFFGS